MINFNELQNKRQITNYSTFTGGVVDGVNYDKPVAYIKAYLQNELNNNGNIDYISAKKHFLSVGITQATTNTQTNLFKSNLNKAGIESQKQVIIKYPLKVITDLSKFTAMALLDNNQNVITIFDDKLYNNEKINKIAIPFNNGYIVITDK